MKEYPAHKIIAAWAMMPGTQITELSNQTLHDIIQEFTELLNEYNTALAEIISLKLDK